MTNLDYLYNPEVFKPIVNRNCFVDKKLGFSVIENGMILPHKKSTNWFGLGGIVDGNGKFIKNSTVWQIADKSYTPPPNQFGTVPKPSFISAYGFRFGVTSSPTIFVAFGF